MEFLAQKQQFKAKELLCHHLAKNKILFQPSAAFASHLYLVDWVWPDPINLQASAYSSALTQLLKRRTKTTIHLKKD
jgi:hypothetical protein